MVAANGICARFLDARGLPSIRRVVKTSERWDRIVSLAAQTGDRLPAAPDSLALADFLAARRAADPARFPDLSHTVIRLLGSGEYVVDRPGGNAPGHFGLAVKDYTHSTAPNRRYPDLVTQRLVKAALAKHAAPYSIGELEGLAAHCTRQEDAANKVERQVRKSAAALLVQSRIGERFEALVTGASPKGTFVRTISPPIEDSANFPVLLEGTRLHLGVLVALMMAPAVWFLMARTTLGSVACALAIVGQPSKAEAALTDSLAETWNRSCSRPPADVLNTRTWPNATT